MVGRVPGRHSDRSGMCCRVTSENWTLPNYSISTTSTCLPKGSGDDTHELINISALTSFPLVQDMLEGRTLAHRGSGRFFFTVSIGYGVLVWSFFTHKFCMYWRLRDLPVGLVLLYPYTRKDLQGPAR